MDAALPPLRTDLHVLAGAPTADGSPTWLVFDPVRNRYFSIGWLDRAVLAAWRPGPVESVVAAVAESTGHAVPAEQVHIVAAFLDRHGLIARPTARGTATLLARHRTEQRRGLMQIAHAYVFFRIPLVYPDRFLTRVTPWLSVLFSPAVGWGLAGLAGLGLYLTARQWDVAWSSLPYVFSWDGAALSAAAIAAVKIAHELGHAVAAKRFGCRVPSMGVGFMLLWPILYTDTSDTWRLTRRQQRLVVAAAGVAVELAVAALATFLWSFFPEGPVRSVLLLLATVSWVMSVAINLNPFMRFDGYFLLSDWLDLPNLQERAFALARWRLRETLFGFGDAAPEWFAPRLRAWLIGYAVATWVYRFVLYISLALAVYHYVFKLAGILLLLLELGTLIGRPVLRELNIWWRRGRQVAPAHGLRTLIGLGVLIAVVAIPWPSQVSLPAILVSADHARLFAPVPSRVVAVEVAVGQAVRAGDVLLVLDNPDLEHARAQTRTEIAALRHQLDRRVARTDILTNIVVLETRLAEKLAEADAHDRQLDGLVLTAPLDGRVAALATGLRPGRWIGHRDPLVELVAPDRARIEAYVTERDLARLDRRHAAVFLPDRLDAPRLPVSRRMPDAVPVPRLPRPDLASVHGGPIAVREEPDGLIPDQALYRIDFDPANAAPSVRQTITGRIHMVADSQSLMAWIGQRVWAVLIRESGF